MRHLYLAATGQNRGKTTAASGLLDGFLGRGLRTGFMKPVGQRTVIEHGVPADEDAVLMKRVFNLPDRPRVDEPGPHPARLHEGLHRGRGRRGPAGPRSCAAHATFADHDVLLIEGTGHAGSARSIGLSNATVAAMLGTPAVIVSEGGVGRPIDEIVLNAALFERHGVPVAGAIVNKVDARRAARDRGDPGAGPGAPRHPAPRRPAVPADPLQPDAGHDPRGPPRRDDPPRPRPRPGHRRRGHRGDGAGHMLQRVGPGTLVIVPGDRRT